MLKGRLRIVDSTDRQLAGLDALSACWVGIGLFALFGRRRPPLERAMMVSVAGAWLVLGACAMVELLRRRNNKRSASQQSTT
ncbi:MAG: hypothetical protein ACRDZ2_10415 [Ilumatobacteraceae bacterium]